MKWNPAPAALLGLLALTPAAPAFGQAETYSIVVQVPFEFVIDGFTLKAGEYVIDTESAQEADALTIRRRDQRSGLIFMTDQAAVREDPKAVELVFERVDGKLHLWQVWGLTASGRQLRKGTAAPTTRAAPAPGDVKRVGARRRKRSSDTEHR